MYKRQLEHYTKGVDGAADLRNGRIDALIIDKPVAETFLGDDNDLKTVSYTHLDVYKRQPLCRAGLVCYNEPCSTGRSRFIV